MQATQSHAVDSQLAALNPPRFQHLLESYIKELFPPDPHTGLLSELDHRRRKTMFNSVMERLVPSHDFITAWQESHPDVLSRFLGFEMIARTPIIPAGGPNQ